MILVDTNVLFDIVTLDPVWSAWSLAALDSASVNGPLFVNAVIYAEISARYDEATEVDRFLSEAGLRLLEIPREALFLASKAFIGYRRAGGAKTGVLPDFFIGAHATVLGIPLLTRDIRRYRTYFPGVRLISPTLS